MEYKQLRQLYADNFSLGNINKDISHKFVLISLICYLYYKARMKQPGVTCYQIIQSINKGQYVTDDFAMKLSIICEDFGYESTEFPLFGITKDKIIPTITDILKSYLPF